MQPSIGLKPQTVNCVILSQHEFKVMAMNESQTYASRLFIDFLSKTFTEGLTG